MVPAALAQDLPKWFSYGADHRTRYESEDRRYPEGPGGGDQQLALRTRLRIGLENGRFHWLGEWWDARTALTSADSLVTKSHAGHHRVTQLRAGVSFGPAAARLTLEAGRFARDFGMRRFIARNVYRNTGNAYDGAIVTAAAKTMSVRGFLWRPLVYLDDGSRLDPAYHGIRLGGLYYTNTAKPTRQFDLYALRLDDGRRTPADERRRHWTIGGRLFGDAGPLAYEVEAAAQTGYVGKRAHSAFFQHAQLGRTWQQRPMQPRLAVLYDYASDAFDTLFGARRFELGPTGIWGLLGRSNLNSPAYVAALMPRRDLELTLTHRAVWLANPRQAWGATDLIDLSGRAGRRVGQQAELRLRYRWTTHLEFDAGVTRFFDGPFVTAVRPDSRGRRGGTYFYVGAEWKLGTL